jgi:hypothetical protein
MERISFYVNYEESFSEELFEFFMKWARNNCEGKPRGWDDSFLGYQTNKYLIFDNWGLHTSKYDPELPMFGVDNNPQKCKTKFSLDEFKQFIGFNSPNYEIY